MPDPAAMACVSANGVARHVRSTLRDAVGDYIGSYASSCLVGAASPASSRAQRTFHTCLEQESRFVSRFGPAISVASASRVQPPLYIWRRRCFCLLLWFQHAQARVAGSVSEISKQQHEHNAGHTVDMQDEVDADLFWKQGYLWIRGFASAKEVASLRSAMSNMIDRWDPTTVILRNMSLPSGTHASVSPLQNHDVDAEHDYSFLLESATKGSFFLEPEALDLQSDGLLRPNISKRQAVRKVAHGLHMMKGPFQDYVQSHKLAHLCRSLGWRSPVIVQTVYRLASPLAPGVSRHQDSTTLFTEPPSVMAVWLALENVTETNGCLQVRGGSHREPIRERFTRRHHMTDGRNTMKLGFSSGSSSSSSSVTLPSPETNFSCLETFSGDAVVMHGALEHFSAAGTDAGRSRESLQVHVVEEVATWSPENWLQYPAGIPFMPLGPPLDAPAKLSSSVGIPSVPHGDL